MYQRGKHFKNKINPNNIHYYCYRIWNKAN